MAIETIKKYTVYDYEQEEIIETRQVAGDDGIVTEQSVLVQPYAKIKAELVISQDRNAATNTSNFSAELVLYAKAGENGDGFKFLPRVSDVPDSYTTNSNIRLGDIYLTSGYQPYFDDGDYFTVAPGKTKEEVIRRFKSNGGSLKIKTDAITDDVDLYGYHNLDGSFTNLLYERRKADKKSVSKNKFNGDLFVIIRDLLTGGSVQTFNITKKFEYDFTNDILPIDRAIFPNTANNFTDETEAFFTYTVTSGSNYIVDTDGEYYGTPDTVTSLQAALSFDGVNADIPYRDIPLDNTNYTFSFTDEERELLRQKAQGSSSVPIYYLLKTTREIGGKYVVYESMVFNSAIQRIFTVVGCEPTLNPSVKDIKPETLALTGNENIFVRYESMVEFSTGAVASKYATIVSQSVQCGSKVIYNLYNGVIDDIESGSFIFNATDSRGLHANQVVITNTAMIEYVKPTCQQEVEIQMSGETGAVVTLKVTGAYYNGSFGASDNELILEARYKRGNGSFTDWQRLGGTPSFNGNTYELTATFTGFSYEDAYTFQTRATDKLNVVETSQYTIRLLPVFDWSETDFNFNVPVNIEAEDLSMHNETIIRHNKAANNTVLSASGGKIYLRPGGTEETSGEAIMHSNGDVVFNGSVDVGGSIDIYGSLTFGGNELADFVIETGEQSMGSNGTWYWRKWASGKSEAWGCRNFGNMAVNTAWGNLYRSAIFTQDLPSKVFIRTPDSININIVHSGFGGWICKHEQTAPSATTTGSFIFVRPASATVTPTNIGFYVVGEWE